MARFGMAATFAALMGATFPWGTLLINILGSFLIGVFSSFASGTTALSFGFVPFLMVGICGGFTTFSSFSLQTLDLAQSGEPLRAGAYILLSVMLCLAFVKMGVMF